MQCKVDLGGKIYNKTKFGKCNTDHGGKFKIEQNLDKCKTDQEGNKRRDRNWKNASQMLQQRKDKKFLAERCSRLEVK